MISFTGNNNRMDTYGYDAAGNLLNDGVHAYAYDGYGNLASVDAGSTANYYYNADGRRVQKNANGSVTNYIYNLEGEQIAEFDVSGNWIRGEMFVGHNHVATYYLGATYFNHSDWLGTERARTLAAGGSPARPPPAFRSATAKSRSARAALPAIATSPARSVTSNPASTTSVPATIRQGSEGS